MNQDAKEAALRLLDYSDRTEKELRDRLTRKKFKNKDIDEVVAFLKEYNFIDDHRYMDLSISECIRNKKGSVKIRNKLIEKGIPRESINKYIADFIDPDTELHNCASQALKILGLQHMCEVDAENNICVTSSIFITERDKEAGDIINAITEKDIARLSRRLSSEGYPTKFIYSTIKKIINLKHQNKE